MISAVLKRWIATIAVGAVAWAPAASAQDAASPWEGYYAGGILGISWAEFDITTAVSTTTLDATSIMGGAFTGYNVLITDNILAGFESDIVFSDLGGEFSFASHRTSWVGRLGALVSEDVLLYGLAGLANGKFRAELTTQGTVTSTTTFINIDDEGQIPVVTTITTPGIQVEEAKRLWGFTVGAGLETWLNVFAFPVRVGGEYRFTNFNEWDVVLAGQLFEIDPEFHELRFRFVVPIN